MRKPANFAGIGPLKRPYVTPTIPSFRISRATGMWLTRSPSPGNAA